MPSWFTKREWKHKTNEVLMSVLPGLILMKMVLLLNKYYTGKMLLSQFYSTKCVSLLIYTEFNIILTEIWIAFLRTKAISGNVDILVCKKEKLHVRISTIDFWHVKENSVILSKRLSLYSKSFHLWNANFLNWWLHLNFVLKWGFCLFHVSIEKRELCHSVS
jgi:hypothetical protein